MVRVRRELLVNEQAIALQSGLLLQWQSDQVPKATLGQSVLVWKQPIVGFQSNFRPMLHRLSQEERTKISSEASGYRLFEKKPNWPPLPERERSNAPVSECWLQMSRTA